MAESELSGRYRAATSLAKAKEAIENDAILAACKQIDAGIRLLENERREKFAKLRKLDIPALGGDQ